MSINLKIEFSGGSEFLVGNQKEHDVTVPLPAGHQEIDVAQLLQWIRVELLKDCDRPELLLDGDTVRPGVLVLVNECDWELMGAEKTKLKPNDLVTFISTLHGG